ncbi:hypothetical protein BH09VER1_BH09VER1_15230 [soil metagenome]
MSKNIDSMDFRVPPGGEIKLSESPARVKPFFKSKVPYHKRLDEVLEDTIYDSQAMRNFVGEI